MASSACGNLVGSFSRLATNNANVIRSKIGVLPQCLQTRLSVKPLARHGAKNWWPEYTMMKDQRKRMTLKKHGVDKVRLNALRKNDILPPELQEIADAEIAAVPRDASINRITFRCVMTSRPRGNVFLFCMSRIVFRHLADYNKLHGVQRAMWGYNGRQYPKHIAGMMEESNLKLKV